MKRCPLDDQISLSLKEYVYAKAGDTEKSLMILNEIEKQAGHSHMPAVHSAQIYIGLGDHEKAFTWLEKAGRDRSVWLIWLGVDPAFDPLRSDQRLKDLMRPMDLPE